MIVYFSATGNSRFAAEYLANLLEDEKLDAGVRIKAGERDRLHSERPWVFVSPIYAWRMAKVMEEYIRATQLGGSRKAYFVLTCGGEIGNAGQYAAALCAEKALHYQGVLEVRMPENYIAMFDVPGEEESRAIVDRAKPVLARGGALIREGKPFPAVRPGLLDRLKSGPVNEGFYRFYVKADAFFATGACAGCGLCAEACPCNNIRLQEGKPVWAAHCTHCMACICGCPVEAIEYGKRSRGKRRYRCPEDALSAPHTGGGAQL